MRLAAFALAIALAACAGPRPDVEGTSASQHALDAALGKIEVRDEAGAIEDLDRALELDPSNAAALRWRGHCLNLAGVYEEAILDYTRAIELEPAFAWTHYARGMAQHNLGRHELAILGYSRAIELDPLLVKAWNWRGFTRKLVHDYAGAARDLDHSLTLLPDDPWTLGEAAKAHVALGELDAAERGFRRLLELDESDASARAQLGFLTITRGNAESGLELLERACSEHAPEETYARIWIWFFAGTGERGDHELAAWFAQARVDDAWEQRLVAFLLGEGAEEALVEAARSETRARVDRGDPPDFLACEAAFYAALRCARRGDHRAAAAWLERVRALPASEAWEWQVSRDLRHALGRT